MQISDLVTESYCDLQVGYETLAEDFRGMLIRAARQIDICSRSLRLLAMIALLPVFLQNICRQALQGGVFGILASKLPEVGELVKEFLFRRWVGFR